MTKSSKSLADKAIREARPKKDTYIYGHPDKVVEIKRLIRRTVTDSGDAHALKKWMEGRADIIYHKHFFREAEKAFYEHLERYKQGVPVMLKPHIQHMAEAGTCPLPGERAEIVQVHLGRKHIGFWVTTEAMKSRKTKPMWLSWKRADSYAEYEPHAVEKMNASHAPTAYKTVIL